MKRLLLGLSLLLAAGCAQTHQGGFNVLDSPADKARPATYLGLPLRTGQLVLSESPGPYSLLFSLCTERYFPFTHAAVLVMEEGRPYVYDVTGEYKPGFDDRPTDGIEGECRRVPLLDYAKPNFYVEIVDPPKGVDPAKVAAWVQARQREGVEFDAYFDWEDRQRLFCTQFVQLALEAGGAPPLELEQVRQHAAIQRLLEWFRVARERSLPAGLFHDPARYAGALGQFKSRAQAYAYFAAKRELHRRLRADQKLGNLFSMQGSSELQLRPSVARFLQRAVSLFPHSQRVPPRAELDRKVQALARELFGEGPAPSPQAPPKSS